MNVSISTSRLDTGSLITEVPAFTPAAPSRPAIVHTDFSSLSGLASFPRTR